jgi:hypothetical protein
MIVSYTYFLSSYALMAIESKGKAGRWGIIVAVCARPSDSGDMRDENSRDQAGRVCRLANLADRAV